MVDEHIKQMRKNPRFKKRVKTADELINTAFDRLSTACEEANSIQSEMECLHQRLNEERLEIVLNKAEILEWLACNSRDIELNKEIVQLLRAGDISGAIGLLRTMNI